MTTPPIPAHGVVRLVDDNAGSRKSMVRLLRAINMHCLDYHSNEAFLRRLDDEPPGCVILSLPDKESLEVQQALRDRRSTLPVIFVTDRPRVSTAVAAMRTGATDFFTRPIERRAVLTAVQRAVARDYRLKAQQKAQQKIQTHLATLTRRERETLEAVVSGLSNRRIAEHLAISPKTVELHRAHAMRKMRANSVAELVRFYLWANKSRADELFWQDEESAFPDKEREGHPASAGRPFTN